MRDRLEKGADSSSGRGMHNSRNQGGREFDREKNVDRFQLDEEREKKEEKLHGTGQATSRGGAKSASGAKQAEGSPYYSGSQQEKAEPGEEGTKGAIL